MKLAKLPCSDCRPPRLIKWSHCDITPSKCVRIHRLPCLFLEHCSDASSSTGHNLASNRWRKEMLDANQAVIGCAVISRVTDRNSSRSHSSNLEGGLPVGKLYTGIVWVVVPEIASMDVFAVIETGNNVQLGRIGKVYRSHWSASMGGEAHDELFEHCWHGVHVLLFLWAQLLTWHAPVKWTDALGYCSLLCEWLMQKYRVCRIRQLLMGFVPSLSRVSSGIQDWSESGRAGLWFALAECGGWGETVACPLNRPITWFS